MFSPKIIFVFADNLNSPKQYDNIKGEGLIIFHWTLPLVRFTLIFVSAKTSVVMFFIILLRTEHRIC